MVSNDDGVDAPGNIALREALAAFADVYTVAPRTEQSAKSHSITLHHPLRFDQVDDRVWAVDGTPADCVYIAFFLKDLLPRRPDLVVSVYQPTARTSATTCTTRALWLLLREGALRGVPSIALSNSSSDMEGAAQYAKRFCKQLLETTPPPGQGRASQRELPSEAAERHSRHAASGFVSTATMSRSETTRAAGTISGSEGRAGRVTSPSREPIPKRSTQVSSRLYHPVEHRSPAPSRGGSVRRGRPGGRMTDARKDFPSEAESATCPTSRRRAFSFGTSPHFSRTSRRFVPRFQLMAEALDGERVSAVIGIESRGFMFGAALADKLGVGFVPVRKPGKLPAATHRVEYELEYGSDAVEIHQDALKPGDRVVIVDDLIATGAPRMPRESSSSAAAPRSPHSCS